MKIYEKLIRVLTMAFVFVFYFVFGLTLFTSLTEGKTQVTCYEGWVPYGESCYLFKDSKSSFAVGEQYCQQHGGHLVHVNDALENTFIKDQLRKLKPAHWYMGITDKDSERVWKWIDTDTVVEFTDFHLHDGGHHNNEDCAVFYVDYDFQWADIGCGTAYNLICEMPSLFCSQSIIG